MKKNLNKYGKFSEDGLEFIITNPVTPRPWMNYLTNGSYCAVISQCAGGYSFCKHCCNVHILRWAPENWHFDRPGRYVFLRDKYSGKYWSSTYQPIRAKYIFYQTRHGLGYTIIDLVTNQIRTKTTFFVPQSDTCEIWFIEIENKSGSERTIQIYPYIEWLIGDYHLELCYRNTMSLYNRVWYDTETKSILAKKTASVEDSVLRPFYGLLFFTSSLPVKGYCTKKEVFLGRYNTEENPETVIKGKSQNFAFCSGEDSVASFYHEVSLKPEESRQFVVILGWGKNYKEVKKMIKKYKDIKTCLEEFRKTKEVWQKRIINNIVIETPDRALDNIMNIWAKYQIYICNFWSGFRSYLYDDFSEEDHMDSYQNAEAISFINPEYTKRKIFFLTKLINEDSTRASGWSETKCSAKRMLNKHIPIWLTHMVSSYIKETGDKKILLQKKFLPSSTTSTFVGQVALYEYLWKNLDYIFNDTGAHGLPRINMSCWNDLTDQGKAEHDGESVMLGMQLVWAIKILAELAGLIGKKNDVKELLNRANIMKDRINKVCWDGNWYIMGITDDGKKYGNKKSSEGKIFLDAQSWAILAGIPDRTRLKRILQSVDKYLDGKHGYALFYPAYTKWNSSIGRISMFSEGTKENAGISCASTIFMILANIIAGRGTKAYQSMKKIMPNSQQDYDIYKMEPYVYSQYIIGPDHPYLYGEAGFSWITETAGLSFICVIEWLFGIRSDYEGLLIEPCIPYYWKKVKIRRPFRKDIYDITIENPYGVEKGVEEIFVDGKKIKCNIIKPFCDGKLHFVRIIIRESRK